MRSDCKKRLDETNGNEKTQLQHLFFKLVAVQHERKPILDRKQDTMKCNENDFDHSKIRVKKESNDGVNYLSLFPSFLMSQSLLQQQSMRHPSLPSPKEPEFNKIEDDYVDEVEKQKSTDQKESSIYDAFYEQKQDDETFKLLNIVEANIENATNNQSSNFAVNKTFLNNLLNENMAQFNIQLPNVLPKMHYICEIGSRVLFTTFDWIREIQVWKFVGDEEQTEIMKKNWCELFLVGLTQIVCRQQDNQELKSLIITTMMNLVKSFIFCKKKDEKSYKGSKIRKMISNIASLNKLFDHALNMSKIENSISITILIRIFLFH
jgi:hypothetical protein